MWKAIICSCICKCCRVSSNTSSSNSDLVLSLLQNPNMQVAEIKTQNEHRRSWNSPCLQSQNVSPSSNYIYHHSCESSLHSNSRSRSCIRPPDWYDGKCSYNAKFRKMHVNACMVVRSIQGLCRPHLTPETKIRRDSNRSLSPLSRWELQSVRPWERHLRTRSGNKSLFF